MRPATTTNAGSSSVPLMSRIRIGKRIFGGFLVILALMAVVAVIGTTGLGQAEAGLNGLLRIVENTVRIMEIDRNVVGLRRNVSLYTANRDDAALKRVEDLKKALGQDIADAEKAAQSPDRKKMIDEVRGYYGEYVGQFDKVVQLRATRDKVLNDEMNPLGAAMRTNLTKVRESAQADGDFRAAALAGAVQENLILARLNAVRFVGAPDAKLVETANAQIAQLPALVADLEAALQNPERKRLVHEVGQSLPKYAAAFKAMSTATLDMYGLINGSMRHAAEEVAKRTTAVKQSQMGALHEIEASSKSTIASATSLAIVTAVIAIVLGLVGAFFIGRGIVKPIQSMTGAMGRLSGGDTTVAIPGVGYKDEVGEMASAVQVFKDNMIEADRLRAE